MVPIRTEARGEEEVIWDDEINPGLLPFLMVYSAFKFSISMFICEWQIKIRKNKQTKKKNQTHKPLKKTPKIKWNGNGQGHICQEVLAAAVPVVRLVLSALFVQSHVQVSLVSYWHVGTVLSLHVVPCHVNGRPWLKRSVLHLKCLW